MKPAYSVIFLTTLIGAGQGLFLALLAADLLSPAEALRPFLVLGCTVALLLTGLGLIASFFHLGHPERAWRTATQWRSSWLSREVIALPVFMGGLFVYGLAHHFAMSATTWIGLLTALACLALFVCTAMIYASIRFLQEWASPVTLINYLLLGCASGFTLATLLAALDAQQQLVGPYAVSAAGFTLAGLIGRGASLVRNARLRPKSTLQTAIGIKHPRIIQKSQGFMGGSFNTREFFHGSSAAKFNAVKWTFLILTFPLPLLGLLAGLTTGSSALFVLTFGLQYLGLLAERWFFFAQASHPQNLYYQVVA